jgi:2-methylisocitrate lyase-like PEP mutase family enzyme
MSTQRDKAEALRALHRPGEPLVLVNVWDAASARVVAAAPGCRAVATASWAIAAAHGLADGEALPRDAMIDAIGIVVRAVELPVTADLERGYGDAGETVALAIEAGAVGCNLEDSSGDGTLLPAAEHAERIAAARANGEALGVPLVINARTDVYLTGGVLPPEERLVAALERGEAYLGAGADCIFIPGLRDLGDLTLLAARMGGPISVLGGAGGPAREQFAAAGVARISYGPGPMGVATAALRRAAETLLAGGEPPADLAFRP